MVCIPRLALFVIGAISFSLPALSDPPPLEVYGRNPTYEDFHISPDGTRIAFIHNHDGKIDLVVRSLSGGPGARVDASKLKVRHIEWSGPNHVLLFATRTAPDCIPSRTVEYLDSINSTRQKPPVAV